MLADPLEIMFREFCLPTMAAVDRLVHHAIIVEFDGETRRVPPPKEKGGG